MSLFSLYISSLVDEGRVCSQEMEKLSRFEFGSVSKSVRPWSDLHKYLHIVISVLFPGALGDKSD